MTKTEFTRKPKSDFFGSLVHLGGKKLAQQGTEFSRKEREVRKHRTSGFRGKK